MTQLKPDPILKPYANTGDKILPPVNTSTTIANQETGFPVIEATKYAQGGTPVKREEFNGVFNYYTQHLAWIQSGGTYTFEQTVSDANNGYNKDVVLWCASVGRYLISLKNNNTANFVTTPSYINDGFNWGFAQLPSIIASDKNNFIIKTFGTGTNGANSTMQYTHYQVPGTTNASGYEAMSIVAIDNISAPLKTSNFSIAWSTDSAGNVKPNASLSGGLNLNDYCSIGYSPFSNGNANCLNLSIYNDSNVSNSSFSILEMIADANTNNALTSLYLGSRTSPGSAVTINNGIQLNYDLRPSMLGNTNNLQISGACIPIFSDFSSNVYTGIPAGSGYFKILTNNTNAVGTRMYILFVVAIGTIAAGQTQGNFNWSVSLVAGSGIVIAPIPYFRSATSAAASLAVTTVNIGGGTVTRSGSTAGDAAFGVFGAFTSVT